MLSPKHGETQTPRSIRLSPPYFKSISRRRIVSGSFRFKLYFRTPSFTAPAQQLKAAMLHTLSSSTALFDGSGTVNDTLDERTRHKEHRGETHSGNNVERTDAPDERTRRKENKREARGGKDVERKDPTKRKRKPNKSQKSKRPSSDSESAVTSDTETDDSSSEDETPPRKRHVEGKGNRRQSKYDSGSDSEDSDDGNSTPTPISKRKHPKRSDHLVRGRTSSRPGKRRHRSPTSQSRNGRGHPTRRRKVTKDSEPDSDDDHRPTPLLRGTWGPKKCACLFGSSDFALLDSQHSETLAQAHSQESHGQATF